MVLPEVPIKNEADTLYAMGGKGNVFYAHGLMIITNQDYVDMFPLPPIAYNVSASFLIGTSGSTIQKFKQSRHNSSIICC